MEDDSPISNSTTQASSRRDVFGHQPAEEVDRCNRSRDGTPETNRKEKEKASKRKAHRKSRYGCQNCKARRIKCDEAKPQCISCKKRKVKCNYLDTSERHHGNSPSDRSAGAINISDVELTYYWTTSTCSSLSTWSSGVTFWQCEITQMGFEHPYILHLVFAFTALHLATSRPDQRDEYMAISERHYEAALPVVTSELAKLNPKHCHAICMAVQLVCLIHCARGPQPGEFLAFGEGGRSEWLIMFRGIRTTREFMNTKYLRVKVPERPVPLYDFPPKYETALADLRDWVDHVSVMGDDERDANLHAVDELAKCYHARYGGTESELLLVFAWLYKMSDEYLRRLQDLEPVPLVIFAWFTVLLGDMERLWYINGWTSHCLTGICEALPVEYLVWIRWPMAQVGFIPPQKKGGTFLRVHTHP